MEIAQLFELLRREQPVAAHDHDEIARRIAEIPGDRLVVAEKPAVFGDQVERVAVESELGDRGRADRDQGQRDHREGSREARDEKTERLQAKAESVQDCPPGSGSAEVSAGSSSTQYGPAPVLATRSLAGQ